MSTESADRLRASDAEREQFATMVREAVGEGRLSLAEGDERLAAVYAVKFRDELRPLVTDLPGGVPPADRAPGTEAVGRRGPYRGPYGRGDWPGRQWSGPPQFTGRPPRRAFAAHVFVVAMVSLALVGLWMVSGAHFFWPAIPLVFFALSLVRHARWRAYQRYRQSA